MQKDIYGLYYIDVHAFYAHFIVVENCCYKCILVKVKVA